ncbi:MAG: Bifunctional glutathionylspermidine synthetase/amidase [Holosporales bacterium]
MLYKVFIFLIISNYCLASTNETEIEFGKTLGQVSGVFAYSNTEDPKHVSGKANFVCYNNGRVEMCKITDGRCLLNHRVVYCGLKWQCVEFARRWMIIHMGLTFSTVNYAYEIWQQRHALSLKDDSLYPFTHCENGKSLLPPKKGDLLIYDTEYAEETGHVAVVADVKGEKLFIAEQNSENQRWVDQYSRILDLKSYETPGNIQRFCIDEVGLIGWMQLNPAMPF